MSKKKEEKVDEIVVPEQIEKQEEQKVHYMQFLLMKGDKLYDSKSPLIAGFKIWIAKNMKEELDVVRLDMQSWINKVEEFLHAPSK